MPFTFFLMSRFFSQRGFTLVELLVTIAIISLLLGMVVVNFRISEQSSAVNLGTEHLAGALREIQNYSLAQKRIVVDASVPDGVIPPGGYGLEISVKQNSYLLYADLDNVPGFKKGIDYLIRTENLPTDAVLENIFSDDAKPTRADIVFTAPNGAMDIYLTPSVLPPGQSATSADLQVCLKNSDCGFQRMINLERDGSLINIE